MNPIIDALRTAMYADLEHHPKDQIASISVADEAHANFEVSKVAFEHGFKAAHWAFNGQQTQIGEIIIAHKAARIVIPLTGNPFLEATPNVAYRFDSEIEQATCNNHNDALEIAFEDDAEAITAALNTLRLQFTPKIRTNVLVFDKIDLAAA